MNIDINQIETYTPTIYVNNSEPDLDETNLNHTEQALKRVTDAANAAILALKSLDSAKIDAAKIVNNLLATDTSTVLSGPMGKALGERLTAAENLLTKLNGERVPQALTLGQDLNNVVFELPRICRASDNETVKSLLNRPYGDIGGEVILIWIPTVSVRYGVQILILTSSLPDIAVYIRKQAGIGMWTQWKNLSLI